MADNAGPRPKEIGVVQPPHGRFQAQEIELVRDYVYHQLLDAMINGRLRPGERIRERDVASELRVSTTPVKEAVLRLLHEGMLVTEPRKGAYVSEAVTTSMEEITRLRARLEGLAAAWAASKISSEQQRELSSIVDEMGPVHSEYDSEIISANARFHDAIREVAGNVFVQRFVQVLLPFDASVRRRALSFPEESERGYREHLEIYQAVVDRDSDRAAAVMEDHILRTFTFVAEHMVDGRDLG